METINKNERVPSAPIVGVLRSPSEAGSDRRGAAYPTTKTEGPLMNANLRSEYPP